MTLHSDRSNDMCELDSTGVETTAIWKTTMPES